MKALTAALVVLVSGCFPILATAQSRDKNQPTPMTSTDVAGSSRKEDRREFYYSFTAGTGELVVTLDVEGLSGRPDSESIVRLTLYDQDSREVGKLERASGLNGERKRHVEKYTFTKPTPIVMRVTFDNGASKYKVELGGEVSFGPTATPSAASGETFQLPKDGVLTIKMRDGSAHTINLPDVQDSRIEAGAPRRD